MSIWLVKTTWNEDETEATEQWEVNVDTAYEAVKEVCTRLRFPPHHIEARRLLEAGESAGVITLPPGEVRRRVPPQ